MRGEGVVVRRDDVSHLAVRVCGDDGDCVCGCLFPSDFIGGRFGIFRFLRLRNVPRAAHCQCFGATDFQEMTGAGLR